MEVEIFMLPTKDDSVDVIEKVFCELTSRYRNGDELNEVEIDWLDTANTWLMQI